MTDPSLYSQRPLFSRGTRLLWRDPATALMLLRMTIWVGVISLGAKTLSLRHAVSLLDVQPRTPDVSRASRSETVVRLLDSLLATNLLFLTPTCWKRAPVLRRFLALEGITTYIVFGVKRKGDDQLNGHAWLEADGNPVYEQTRPEYKITFRYPE
jgi:Transglutaminase-like superfamily